MCGFIGIYNSTGSLEDHDLEKIRFTEYLKRRGPDEFNVMRTSNCVIGHSRLAITHSADIQPRLDGDSMTCFNGEIYNYSVLAKGSSEIKCIHELLSDNVERVELLDGFFAIAHVDSESLYLITDSYAEKPLFVAKNGNYWFFGSDFKWVKEASNKSLDQASIEEIRRVGFDCCYSGDLDFVNKIPASSVLRVNKNDWKLEEYDTITPEVSSCKSFDETFIKAVEKRLTPDCAVLFSGGLDSTAIVLALKKLGVERPIYSVLPVNEKERREFENIKNILDIETIDVSVDNASDALNMIKSSINTPNADLSTVASMLLYEAVSKRGHRVVIGGDGADELFLGYTRHVRLRKYWNLLKLYSILPRFLHRLAGSNRANSVIYNESMARKFFQFESDFSNKKTLPSFDDLVHFDRQTYLSANCCAKVDNASAFFQIEVRLPFLDRGIRKLAMDTPISEFDYRYTKAPVRKFVEEAIGIEFSKAKYGFDYRAERWPTKQEFAKIVGSQL